MNLFWIPNQPTLSASPSTQLTSKYHVGVSGYAVIDIMAMAPRAGELVNVSAFLTSLAMAWGYFTTQGGTLLLVDKKSGSPLSAR